MSPRSRKHRLATFDDDELVRRAQAGHVLAEQVLLERYRRVARAKRRGYFLVGGDREDVEQEALIGLHKAIHGYREGCDTTFRLFAEVCVARQLTTAIRGATRRKHQVLNASLTLSPPDAGDADERGAAALHDLIGHDVDGDPLDQVVTAEQELALRRTIEEVLSPLEVAVLDLHLEGWTYEEIAGRLARTVKSVDNALQRARRKAESHLAGAQRHVPPAVAS